MLIRQKPTQQLTYIPFISAAKAFIANAVLLIVKMPRFADYKLNQQICCVKIKKPSQGLETAFIV